MKESLVIIPTYNEIENIENMVRKVMSLPYDFHLLIVEDNSPDGTASKVQNLQNEFGDRLFMIQRKGKLGLGTAYISGFKWGLENNYQFIYEMDCDFSHNPDYLIDLRNCMVNQSADLAVGSRYIKGGGVVNWPKNRIFLSRGASIYVRLILGLPVMDTTAGFVCYKRRVLETIDLDKIKFKGYAFQIQMKYAAYSLGFKIIETPIIFKDREFGESKISSNIITEAIFGVIKMRWKSFFMTYKKN